MDPEAGTPNWEREEHDCSIDRELTDLYAQAFHDVSERLGRTPTGDEVHEELEAARALAP